MSDDAKKPPRRGRPVEKSMPEPIPDTPENVARAIMRGPPKKVWRYLKKNRKGVIPPAGRTREGRI